jgi:hypothetical protein
MYVTLMRIASGAFRNSSSTRSMRKVLKQNTILAQIEPRTATIIQKFEGTTYCWPQPAWAMEATCRLWIEDASRPDPPRTPLDMAFSTRHQTVHRLGEGSWWDPRSVAPPPPLIAAVHHRRRRTMSPSRSGLCPDCHPRQEASRHPNLAQPPSPPSAPQHLHRQHRRRRST